MYLPKFKYKRGSGVGKNLTDVETGLPYVGPIVEDFLGRIFKGSNPYTATEQLAQPASPEPELPFNFQNLYIQPTEKDYISGKYVRYFIKDSRSGKIVEVDKKSYIIERQLNKLYRRTLRLEWYIKGQLEDLTINGYPAPGLRTKNQNVIDQAEKDLPGIGIQILKDPGQFVRQ